MPISILVTGKAGTRSLGSITHVGLNAVNRPVEGRIQPGCDL